MAGTHTRPAKCFAGRCNTSQGQCFDSSENVREPVVFCGQASRYGSADHSLRSTSRSGDRPGEGAKIAWHHDEQPGYTRRSVTFDCSDECRGKKRDPEY